MGLDIDRLTHASVCLDNALANEDAWADPDNKGHWEEGVKYWIKKCVDDLNYILMLVEDE